MSNYYKLRAASRAARRENPWSYPILALILLVSMGVSAFGGYIWGTQKDIGQQAEVMYGAIADQRKMLIEAQTALQANMDAFTQRIGLIQAHVNRLNALGSKLIAMADIDSQEFGFDNIPPMGGIDESLDQPGFVDTEMTKALETLELTLLEKEQQLQLLDELMISNTLQNDVKPQGMPVEGGWISSKYGYRNDPFSGKPQFHKGIDIAAVKGSPILAAAGGVVIKSERHPQYGLLVEIDHGNGYLTRYGHASSLLVNAGEVVKKGDSIAKVGNTGRSTGPHLHFEVVRNGEHINPLSIVKTE